MKGVLTELFIGFCVGVVFTSTVAKFTLRADLDEMKTDAVKHGAAEWVVDQNTGKTTFRWRGGAK